MCLDLGGLVVGSTQYPLGTQAKKSAKLGRIGCLPDLTGISEFQADMYKNFDYIFSVSEKTFLWAIKFRTIDKFLKCETLD